MTSEIIVKIRINKVKVSVQNQPVQKRNFLSSQINIFVESYQH